METLQSKRIKNLAPAVLFVLSFLLLVSNLVRLGSGLDDDHLYRLVTDKVKLCEEMLDEKNRQNVARSGELMSLYEAGMLEHGDLGAREALVVEENGDIGRYYGEIYHFEFVDLLPGQWCLIRMGEDIFFLEKPVADVYYVKFLFKLNDNFILRELKPDFPYARLIFNRVKEEPAPDRYHFDESQEMFIYEHSLYHSDGQLQLNMGFSRGETEDYYLKNRRIMLCLAILGIFTAVFLATYGKKKLLSRLAWLAMLAALFYYFSITGTHNLYLKWLHVEFYSIYQLLAVLAVLISIMFFARRRFTLKMLCFLLFNAAILPLLELGNRVLAGVDFTYADFQFRFDYLSLLLLLFFLHLAPLFLLRNTGFRLKGAYVALFIMVQGGFFALFYYGFGVRAISLLLFFAILFISVFFKKGFLSRLAVVGLVAISVFYLIQVNTESEKKTFVTQNLKNIFLNQNNYARFIAREMVHEINSRSGSLVEFFQENSTSRLVDIWRMSIARRENIASGIFLLSKDGDITSQYSYQMPFIRLPSQNFFPFWAIEDATTELYGKEISLAIASVSVKRGRQHLGYIIVQVLNSPRLILRHQDKVNIFTIDRKIDGKDFSYIKLNQENRIIENPSNINLRDIAGLLENDDRWVRFNYTGLEFSGYIFKHNKNSIIVFFPENTFFKNFSEIIKIFLWFFALFLLLYFRELKKIEWKSIYYSFSIRVFSFLLLISMITAVVFSIFSFNFNTQSSERKLSQVKYEKGRTAQNICYNFLSGDEEISQDHLFMISEILNSDVGVYESGVFLDSSNQRKSIDAEIPIYLHTRILDLLNEKNQKFVLSDDGYSLFFKIGDYIFDVEFSYTWRKILSERSYHTDFIITLFFILAVIGFSSAFFFRDKILSPINELNRGMAKVEKGNLEKLRQIPSEIELKSLYLGFNSMVEGIRRDKQNISEISRMRTIIKLGRRVAHEVKNPLTPIKLSAEQIMRTLADKGPGYEEIIKKSVHFIMDETEHLKKVSYGFLDLSRLDEIMAVEFDFMDLLKEEVFHFNQAYSNVDFSIRDDSGRFPVCLDKIKIKQVLTNLLLNSIEAIGEKKGHIVLGLEDAGDWVILDVADNGSGMEDEEIDKIFNMDYSTKEVGTGLGLFIVRRIVELHKGKIRVESNKDRGTRVILDFPWRVD